MDRECSEHRNHDGGSLNLKQAAAKLGVHYMTAYRYVRQGRLDAVRDGTQWRVSARSVEQFGTRDATVAPRATGSAAWTQRFEHGLLAGDEPTAWRVIEGALAAGRTPTFCYLEILAPALESIGTRWAVGELQVADQCIATSVASRIVARLGARFRRPGRVRGTAIFGSPAGELHSLPVAIVADLARLAGYASIELGADVPAEAFRVAVERANRLLVVGIGITSLESIDSAQEAIEAIRAADAAVPIVIGGQAAATPQAHRLRGVTAFAPAGEDALALLESVASRHERSRSRGRSLTARELGTTTLGH